MTTTAQTPAQTTTPETAAPVAQGATQAPTQTTETAEDFGSKQEKPKGFSATFLKLSRSNPYLPPESIVVAGDRSTEKGIELTGTFLDDGRANIAWANEHETLVFGLLTGSGPVKIRKPVLNEDGSPKIDPETSAAITELVEVMVTNGASELVYLQGSDDDWYPIMHDGRQRRRAALELQRRVNWIASLLSAMGDAAKAKPARRNLLIKVGQRYAKGETWAELAKELNIPESVGQYQSPEIGIATTLADGVTVEYPANLSWLNETFAKMVVGCDDLGDAVKRGWLSSHKGDGAIRAHTIYLKYQIVGTNVDPLDPASLLDSVASKEAQVPTPPSLLADQIQRILSAKENPSDQTSEPLYTRAAVRARFGFADSTLVNYELLSAMCDEVKALIDSGRMSMTVALGKRESAFITWPKKGDRTPLPFDKQRLVLSHLLATVADEEDEDGPVKLIGAKILEIGQKLRNKAMTNKLGPVGADDEDDSVLPAPNTTAAGTGTAQGTGTAAGPTVKPAKRSKSVIDAASFREHSSRALSALVKPAETDVAATAIFNAETDRLNLARCLGLVLSGAEPIGVLDAWPSVRDVVIASMPVAAPVDAAPEITEEALILDFISVAVEDATTKGLEVPVVTEATESHGKKPTEAQIASCNAKIGEWVNAFKKDQGATVLDEYLMIQVVNAQNSVGAQPAA